MKRLLIFALCATLALPGCAMNGAGVNGTPATQNQVVDRAVMAEYVQKLPLGTAIRIERSSGRTLRGTLMKATDRTLIVQPRTRIAEPAVEIPLAEVLSVVPEATNGGSSIAKAIGVGAAAGAGAALAVFFIIVAAFSD